MQTANEWLLPLFIHQEEPLLIYVVNNKLLRFQEHGGYDRSFTKVFYFLNIMNNDPKIDFVIPKKLSEYLKKDSKVYSTLGYPLIGEPDYTPYKLDLELKITTDDISPITLYDIKHYNTMLDDQISLSAQDAFFLFSNICTNARCDWFRKILRQKGCFELNIPLLKKTIRNKIDIENIENNQKIVISDACSFMLDYLVYLKEQLQNNSISQEYILKLSGARLLAFLAEFELGIVPICSILDTLSNQNNLHINEKIVYYSLFEIYNFSINFWRKDSEMANNFNQLYHEKQAFLKSLRHDIRSKLKSYKMNHKKQ